MNTIMENVKKAIERNADSLPQKIIGNFIAIIQLFVEGLLIFALALVPIVGGIGSLIISIREGEKYAQGLNTMRKDILKDDEMTDTLAANNSYKRKLVGIITSYQRKLKVLDQKLEKAMKEQRKYEISVEKEKKLTAEAVEFEEKKAMLYEACSNGEITIQEREELLSELKEELFYTEETIDAIVSEDEELTKQEKFDKIKKDLMTAMKEQDKFKLSVLRMLKSALQAEEINKKSELTDDEVLNIIKSAHDKARKILEENIDKLHELSEFLLEKETITGEEFMEILNGKPVDEVKKEHDSKEEARKEAEKIEAEEIKEQERKALEQQKRIEEELLKVDENIQLNEDSEEKQ